MDGTTGRLPVLAMMTPPVPRPVPLNGADLMILDLVLVSCLLALLLLLDLFLS